MSEGMKTRRQELEELVELNEIAIENLIDDIASGGGYKAKNLLRETITYKVKYALLLNAEPKA